MELQPDKYDKLVNDLKGFIEASRDVAKGFVFETHWKIGDMIQEVLGEKSRCEYGKKVVSRLAEELKTTKAYLYESWDFRGKFTSIAEFEKTNAKLLSWSDFREEQGIRRKMKEEVLCECGGNFKKTLVCEKCGKNKG